MSRPCTNNSEQHHHTHVEVQHQQWIFFRMLRIVLNLKKWFNRLGVILSRWKHSANRRVDSSTAERAFSMNKSCRCITNLVHFCHQHCWPGGRFSGLWAWCSGEKSPSFMALHAAYLFYIYWRSTIPNKYLLIIVLAEFIVNNWTYPSLTENTDNWSQENWARAYLWAWFWQTVTDAIYWSTDKPSISGTAMCFHGDSIVPLRKNWTRVWYLPIASDQPWDSAIKLLSYLHSFY